MVLKAGFQSCSLNKCLEKHLRRNLSFVNLQTPLQAFFTNFATIKSLPLL